MGDIIVKKFEPGLISIILSSFPVKLGLPKMGFQNDALAKALLANQVNGFRWPIKNRI